MSTTAPSARMSRSSSARRSGSRTRSTQVDEDENGAWEEYRLVVTNDQRVPVRFESRVRVRLLGRGVLAAPPALPLRDGRPLWAVTVPANGTATLRYRITERPDPAD